MRVAVARGWDRQGGWMERGRPLSEGAVEEERGCREVVGADERAPWRRRVAGAG